MTEADAPTFTIRATDELACATISAWLVLARASHVKAEKIASAEMVLARAQEWQRLNRHKVKRAD